MNPSEPIDVTPLAETADAEGQSQAAADASPMLPVKAPAPSRPVPAQARALTSGEAKTQAIGELTMGAYARASQLVLTAEESAALTADFPDDAFRPGAAGKEHLIYIEHACLRERLNTVLGLGQWAIVQRDRWKEAFEYWDNNSKQKEQAHRVYVEAMLVVRGCFVAEAIGDMVYYPKNQQTNFGDAVEGAKSAAFRRMAKELGVGLQAWKKDFAEGWWARRKGGGAARSGAVARADMPKSAGDAPPPSAPSVRPAPDEAWRSYIVPFGKYKDARLEDVPKGALYGFWANFKVETTWQGKPRSLQQIGKDGAFRAALDAAGVHYNFRSNEATSAASASGRSSREEEPPQDDQREPVPPEDDVPF